MRSLRRQRACDERLNILAARQGWKPARSLGDRAHVKRRTKARRRSVHLFVQFQCARVLPGLGGGLRLFEKALLRHCSCGPDSLCCCDRVGFEEYVQDTMSDSGQDIRTALLSNPPRLRFPKSPTDQAEDLRDPSIPSHSQSAWLTAFSMP